MAEKTIRSRNLINRNREKAERKQAEEELVKQSRELMRERQRLFDVLENLPAMICLLTPDYHITYANRAFKDKFGEADGRHCYEYCFGFRNGPCPFCESYRVLDTGQPHNWELVSADGKTIIDAYDYPFTDIDGSPLILEMDIDITERRHTEETLKNLNQELEARVIERTAKLKDSEARYRRIIETTNEGVWIINPDHKVIFVNDRMASMLGYMPEEMIGKISTSFFIKEQLHEVELIVKAITQGKPGHYEFKLRCKDGFYIWVMASICPLFSDNGQFIGSIGMNSNITERKRAEQELEEKLNMLEQAQLMVIDFQGEISFWNQGAERMYGYSKKEAIGQISYKLLRTVFPRRLREIKREILKKGKWEGELTHTRQDGSKVVVDSIWTFYQGDKSRPPVIIEANNDITKRKQAEQELIQSRNELAKANNTLRQFANKITQVQEEERKRIAYELHDDTAQYLSILKMQIGALAESEEIQNPKAKEKLQFLEKDADRAFNDVRRYSHELRPIVLENQGLVAALEQIADDFNALEQLSIGIHIEGVEPILSEEVKLGFFRIAQEALNNSRKHAKANQVDIYLRFSHKQIKMTVNDNGEGFDTKRTFQRSGDKGSLGLTSMKERARLINAVLKIESEIGKGTKVILESKIKS